MYAAGVEVQLKYLNYLDHKLVVNVPRYAKDQTKISFIKSVL